MLKITYIRRHGLERDCCLDSKTNKYYCRHYYYDCVERINFVRDGLHYSIQLGEGEGSDITCAIDVRCKEDKSFYKCLGYGTLAFLRLLGDWNWRINGTTYQTFPTDQLEQAVFGGE